MSLLLFRTNDVAFFIESFVINSDVIDSGISDSSVSETAVLPSVRGTCVMISSG